jgi:hypothetical protein
VGEEKISFGLVIGESGRKGTGRVRFDYGAVHADFIEKFSPQKIIVVGVIPFDRVSHNATDDVT